MEDVVACRRCGSVNVYKWLNVCAHLSAGYKFNFFHGAELSTLPMTRENTFIIGTFLREKWVGEQTELSE